MTDSKAGPIQWTVDGETVWMYVGRSEPEALATPADITAALLAMPPEQRGEVLEQQHRALLTENGLVRRALSEAQAKLAQVEREREKLLRFCIENAEQRYLPSDARDAYGFVAGKIAGARQQQPSPPSSEQAGAAGGERCDYCDDPLPDRFSVYGNARLPGKHFCRKACAQKAQYRAEPPPRRDSSDRRTDQRQVRGCA